MNNFFSKSRKSDNLIFFPNKLNLIEMVLFYKIFEKSEIIKTR